MRKSLGDDLASDPHTVLIVDDSDTARSRLRTWLEGEGYAVTDAPHGGAGIQEARDAMPDLLVVDINMPGIDGYKVISAVRNLPDGETVPIVVLTSVATDDAKQRAKRAGATALVAKPFHGETFGPLLKKLLSR